MLSMPFGTPPSTQRYKKNVRSHMAIVVFEFYDNKLVNKYYSTNTKLDAWSSDTSLILLDGS